MKLDRIKNIVLFTVLCALLLCSCAVSGTHTDQPQTTTDTTSAEDTAPPETDPVQTEPVQSEPSEPESAETATPDTVPYTTALGAAVSIFQGPSYDNSFVKAMGKDGIYTIVEEIRDEDGNLWGKLKSGVGWVDLTKAHSTNNAPILAYFADDDLLNCGNYHEYIMDDSEYMVKIVFRANEALENVRFISLQFANDSYEAAEMLYALDALSPDIPFVAGVVFYGDMTTYGITFTDDSGDMHHYVVYISGRNGELVMNEYIPD